jgi:hypothetical protein
MIEIPGCSVFRDEGNVRTVMNYAQDSAKLAELRARTDRDLIAVLSREVDSIRALRTRRTSAARARLERVRVLLAAVDAARPERLLLERELDVLWDGREAVLATAC